MEVSINYLQVLEESLKKELIWLVEEFEILFNLKPKTDPKNDKKLANEILDYVHENSLVYDNIVLYNLFSETMEKIEKIYSDLF